MPTHTEAEREKNAGDKTALQKFIDFVSGPTDAARNLKEGLAANGIDVDEMVKDAGTSKNVGVRPGPADVLFPDQGK